MPVVIYKFGNANRGTKEKIPDEYMNLFRDSYDKFIVKKLNKNLNSRI